MSTFKYFHIYINIYRLFSALLFAFLQRLNRVSSSFHTQISKDAWVFRKYSPLEIAAV